MTCTATTDLLSVLIMPPPKLLTSSQLATELGLSRQSIARYAARGWITPALRTPGGQYRWNLDDVKAEMAALWKRE